MSTTMSRRAILTAGAATAAAVSLPGASAYAHGRHHPRAAVKFTLRAEVLDGGEQVTGLVLDASRLGRISGDSLSTKTFDVHVTATNPVFKTVAYDLDREVTAVRVDRRGNIEISLSYGEGQIGGGTLDYQDSRNVLLDLDYTITQKTPLQLRNHKWVTITDFEQGRLEDAEVDAFSYAVSGSGMNYRLYSPRGMDRSGGHGKRPLIVWLHGGGEGGLPEYGYYDNEATLRANRGALGFATAGAQRIFGGAYVVAPQCRSAWMDDGPAFAPLIDEVIREVSRRHDIDHDRIHIVGCSNGGYMSIEMSVLYPRLFASSVPISSVVAPRSAGEPPLISDDKLRAITTPTWLIASRDDDTVDPVANTEHTHDLVPGSIMSLYDTVTWNGYRFPGHWSWIYVAQNDPSHHGTHIWQWMDRQHG